MTTRRLVGAVLLVALLAGCFGTALASQKKQYKIGVVVASVAAEIGAIYYNEAIARIKERGAIPVGAVANNDDEVFIKNIENMVQGGCNAIILGYGRTEAYKGAIQKARKAGVVVAGMYAGFVDGMLFDVAANDFAMSSMVSKYMADRLRAKGGGEIALLFSDDMYWCRARRHALEAVLKEYPDVKIVAEHSVKWDNLRDDAMQAAQNILLAHPSIDAFWAIFDLPALGVAQALLAAGRKDVFVVGIDGDNEALDMIAKTSVFGATVKQQPEKIARTVVDKVIDYLDGKWKPLTRSIDVDAILVTKDNIADFWPKKK